MPAAAQFRIRLAKEDFKFSAAHFTLFPGGRAELLHGHNYRVRLELAGSALSDVGLLVDVSGVKAAIRRRCSELDERTLIPAETDRLEISRSDGLVDVRFGGRAYRFPEDDVVLLPLVNVSIELLARLLWGDIVPSVEDAPVEELAVEVEETPGQSCVYRARLGGTRAP